MHHQGVGSDFPKRFWNCLAFPNIPVDNKVKPVPGCHGPGRRVQTHWPDPSAEGRDLRNGKVGPTMAAAGTRHSHGCCLSPSKPNTSNNQT